MEPPSEDETERPKPLLQYRDNLEKCLSLDINVVLPGHGKIFTDVEEVVSRVYAKQENRANKVLSLLKEYSKTAFQLCERTISETI